MLSVKRAGWRRALLLIVPACGREAYEHFKRTVERSWSLEELLGLGVELPEHLVERLRRVGRFHVWGCISGGVPGWERAWETLDRGWVVAFYRDGAIVCYGVVFAKVRDPVLAERLWGRDARGRTWEYVYFIKDLRWVSIPWDRVRSELGYKESFTPQGHTVVSEEKVRRVVEKYGDVLSFFEALAGRGRAKRKYDPASLKLPTLGGERLRELAGVDDPYLASLRLYGKALSRLLEVAPEAVAKDAAESVAEELVGSAAQKFAQARAVLYNDLRRLCVLSIGGGGDWGRGLAARYTGVGSRLKGVYRALRDLGVDVEPELLAALIFAYCLEGLVEGCRRDEAGVCVALAERGLAGLDSQTRGVAERALEVLKSKRELLLLALGYGADPRSLGSR